MYIKSLVLDGFKSYGSKTHIGPFDHEFNAITGLNGTGKSNILDSICFVLGISNLTNVRATSLTDLIYKAGQAGVTKATVTVVFDNSEASKSPMSYEKFKEITVSRQIVVGGKNRYMINGSVVTNKQIVDFFNSVQLNVNNPHFLIMQGRITKVLNMKPPEILSMIQEAAGTSMYENKKIAAQKTVEKKDSKLREMNDMVAEQINPKMQKLKDDKTQFLEYQKIQRELESLNRIKVAYYFSQSGETYIKEKERLVFLQNEAEVIQTKKAEAEEKISEIEKKIQELQAKLSMEDGQDLSKLDQTLRAKEMEESKAKAHLKNHEEQVKGAKQKVKAIEKTLRDEEKVLGQKEAEMEKAEKSFGSIRKAEQDDSEALVAAEKKFEAVSSGLLSNEDGQDATLQDQLMNAKEQLASAETEVKQCTMEAESIKKDLSIKVPELKKTEHAFGDHTKNLQVKEKQLASLKAKLQAANYEDGYLERLQDRMTTLNREIKNMHHKVEQIEMRNPQIRFSYRDPEPNFNRKKVRGPICTLFTVKDPKFARALETVAGGKLYNIVVEDENTSVKLIKNGQLTRRYTFAPMNKIRGSKMQPNKFQDAQRLVGAENVFLAQSLINYDPQYEQIMSWVFGQTLVTLDLKSAHTICESKHIQRKAVTLEGDVFDPAGVISGGANIKSAEILLIVGSLISLKQDLNAQQTEYQQVQRDINTASGIANVADEYKILEIEVESIKGHLQQTAYSQLKREIDELNAALNEKNEILRNRSGFIKEQKKKIADLEYQLKNLHVVREKALKAAEAELKRLQKKAEESRNKWKKLEEGFEIMQIEIDDLKKSIAKEKDELQKSLQTVEDQQKELDEFRNKMGTISNEVKELKEQFKLLQAQISKKNSTIQALVEDKNAMEKNISEFHLSKTTNDYEQKKSTEAVTKYKNLIKELQKQHPWISEDKEYFGQKGGIYDFEVNDPRVACEKIKRLEEIKDTLSKSVNAKALDVLGHQEEQFMEVLSKKEIVEEDKTKILSVIEELDVRKEEVMKSAWEQVNYDFNSILSTLLPGSHAKLQTVDGKELIHGLQIKVGFGGIWKESLDELSGGQRSLVALSFILAMLLFKPAPLYILDEVDAALDQSHTQNIGLMLKKHFKQSQFIVVSLKDGMFSNANVLFRTSFVDGMSCVTRTTNDSN